MALNVVYKVMVVGVKLTVVPARLDKAVDSADLINVG
jgi:hypothetical protein